MAVEPWIFACHHLTTGHAVANLAGDGALSAVSNNATLVNDDVLGRVVLSYQNTSQASLWTKNMLPSTRLVFGIRLNFVSKGTGSQGGGFRDIVEFVNNAGQMSAIRWNRDTNQLAYFTGTTNRAVIASTADNSWMYIEVAIEFSASSGILIARANGVRTVDTTVVTSNVAVGTGPNSIIGYSIASNTGSPVFRCTDWQMKDFPDSPDSPFWGPLAPVWEPVQSDENNDGWVASDAGDIYDALLNNNAKYATPGGAGDTVEMGLPSVPGGTTFILGKVAVAVSTAPAGGGTIGLDFKDGVNVTEGNPNGRVIGDQLALTTQAVLHLSGPGNVPWTPELADDANLLLTAVVS